jgi:protein O-GlcNAc transferase
VRPIDQAIAAHRSGNLDAAETLYRGVLAANRRDFDALHMLGIICAQRGNFGEAEKLLRDALSVDGSVAQCLHNYGNVQSRLGRHTDAVASYRRALALAADYAPVYSDLGNAQAALGDFAGALVSHDQAVKFMPRSAPAHYNRGIAQFKLGQNDEALKSYNWAVFLDPNYAEAQCNRGDIFREWKQFDEAAVAYDRALSVNPKLAGAWHGRGVILLLLKRYEDAIVAFDKALALKPDLNEVPGMRLLAKMHICDWRDVESEAARILTATRSGKQASFPFAMLTIRSSAEDQMRCAVLANANLPSFPPLWTGQIYSHDRIRVAYISSDFREHPVAQLATGLFERHDRSRFEVTAISLRAEEPESDLRRRLKSAFARFVEVQSKSDNEIADLIRQLEIDIAVDLNGLTDGRRPTFWRGGRRPCRRAIWVTPAPWVRRTSITFWPMRR